MTRSELFVRDASGLVKEFRPVDVFVFNVLGYGLGLVLAVTPTFLGKLYPNAEIQYVLTFGVLLSICNGLTYGLFAAAMPRSGGDYVFIGRTLGPWLGFAANWGFTWSQFFGLGVFAAWCVSDSLVPSMTTFGYTAGYPAVTEAAKSIGTPNMVLGVGSAFLLSVLLLSILGMRILKRFFMALFILAVLGTLAMLYVFAATSHEAFVARFNDFMLAHANLPDAYRAVVELGRQQGLEVGEPGSIWDAFRALPVGYWVFIGFTYSVYVGGEVREPQRSQVIGILGALLFGYVVYMFVMYRYYAVVGRDFNNAVALLAGTDANPLPAGTSMVFFAGVCTDNVPLNLLISVSNFIWFYMLILIIAQISIRNIFAWAFDRLMPAALTRLTRSQGTPWVAALVVVALGELFLVLYTSQLLGFINYISLYSVCFLTCGIAAVVFPFRRKRFFESSPAAVRRRIAGVPLITLMGAMNVFLFAIVLYSALTNPGVSGVSGNWPTIFVAVVYLSGVVVYFVGPPLGRLFGAESRPGAQLLFEELPPD